MQSEGFEPTIPGIRRLQTYALDCTTTSSGKEIMEKPWILSDHRYCKLFHHLAHIYSNIQKVRILRQVSLEASRYQQASSEAAASDVTVTILLPVSPSTEAAQCIWVGIFHILVRTQLLLPEVFHGSLQCLQSYAQAVPKTRCQAIPFSSIFAEHPVISFYINQSTA